MTAEETVNAFIAAIEAKDFDAAMSHVAEDCYYENVPLGSMTGRSEMRAFLEPMFAEDGPVEFEIRYQVANDTTVMNDRVDRFIVRGRQIELPVAGVFEVSDGLITFWRDFFDQGMFARAVKGE